MNGTTIKRAIADALDDLSKDDFIKFGFHLRDRREEPRVTRRDVEDKSTWEIAQLLASKFTEPKALQVTLDTLRQMDYNGEAERLSVAVLHDSKTKAFMDKGDPTFRKTSTGELVKKPSQEALDQKASQCSLQSRGLPVKNPEEVEVEAKACIISEGGDLSNDWLVLSRYTIQFGQYKGKTFKWLLENDVYYVAYIVTSHQKDQEPAMCQNTLMANKDSLTVYANAYSEFVKVRFLYLAEDGRALVGFGRYELETLKDLYESKNPGKIGYVEFLRSMRSTCTPGSKMEVAIEYILLRDQRQDAAAANRPTTSRARARATSKLPTGRKWV